jgi:arsenite methyltransferase
MGAAGSVTGVDMTDAQLDVARKYSDDFCTKTLGYAEPNMKFVKVRWCKLNPICAYSRR